MNYIEAISAFCFRLFGLFSHLNFQFPASETFARVSLESQAHTTLCTLAGLQWKNSLHWCQSVGLCRTIGFSFFSLFPKFRASAKTFQPKSILLNALHKATQAAWYSLYPKQSTQSAISPFFSNKRASKHEKNFFFFLKISFAKKRCHSHQKSIKNTPVFCCSNPVRPTSEPNQLIQFEFLWSGGSQCDKM